jgi:AAA domain
LRLLEAAQLVGAKVVAVGDHRQLGAVGPGGAFEALQARWPGAVQVLDENVRQTDPAERAALAQLRSGDINKAVGWYVAAGQCGRTQRTGPGGDDRPPAGSMRPGRWRRRGGGGMGRGIGSSPWPPTGKASWSPRNGAKSRLLRWMSTESPGWWR